MRVGRIGYINCYPVYGAIDRGLVPLAAELVTGTPSELNDLLAAGELDVSVVSAVEYARQARHYILLPDLAISCDGAVRSVALFSRRTVGQCCSPPPPVRRSRSWNCCVVTCGRCAPTLRRREPRQVISSHSRVCRTTRYS